MIQELAVELLAARRESSASNSRMDGFKTFVPTRDTVNHSYIEIVPLSDKSPEGSSVVVIDTTLP
jgi:hypothetical protein